MTAKEMFEKLGYKEVKKKQIILLDMKDNLQ